MMQPGEALELQNFEPDIEGGYIKVDLFRTNPPWQLNAVGCVWDKSGIL
jgi:hypothetical protein